MSTESVETVLQKSACDLAFEAGQALERLLTDKAIEVARHQRGDNAAVTVADVISCFHPSLIDEVREAVRVPADERRRRRLSA
jgi:hypothetical protein